MASSETMSGASYDTLIGGVGVMRLVNVNVSSDTELERGALLAGGWDGTSVTVHLATATDTANCDMYIAASDEASVTVTNAYSKGVFNRAAIKVGEGLNVRDFEHNLRLNNILLTEVK